MGGEAAGQGETVQDLMKGPYDPMAYPPLPTEAKDAVGDATVVSPAGSGVEPARWPEFNRYPGESGTPDSSFDEQIFSD